MVAAIISTWEESRPVAPLASTGTSGSATVGAAARQPLTCSGELCPKCAVAADEGSDDSPEPSDVIARIAK